MFWFIQIPVSNQRYLIFESVIYKRYAFLILIILVILFLLYLYFVFHYQEDRNETYKRRSTKENHAIVNNKIILKFKIIIWHFKISTAKKLLLVLDRRIRTDVSFLLLSMPCLYRKWKQIFLIGTKMTILIWVLKSLSFCFLTVLPATLQIERKWWEVSYQLDWKK